jgi:hypothetical protein
MNLIEKVSYERLRELLAYDPISGLFQWKNPPMNHMGMKNYAAGCIRTGYVLIKIDGRKYKAHRLAWLYVYGEWPEGDIDHANGCPLDNRIDNLRIATNQQNQANRRRNHDKETPKGVRKLPGGKFQARISINKKQRAIGTFRTENEAQAAYMVASNEHYREFARAS